MGIKFILAVLALCSLGLFFGVRAVDHGRQHLLGNGKNGLLGPGALTPGIAGGPGAGGSPGPADAVGTCRINKEVGYLTEAGICKDFTSKLSCVPKSTKAHQAFTNSYIDQHGKLHTFRDWGDIVPACTK